jgi:hypothetical protein
MESMESQKAGFPLFPHSLEIPSGFPHSHGPDDGACNVMSPKISEIVATRRMIATRTKSRSPFDFAQGRLSTPLRSGWQIMSITSEKDTRSNGKTSSRPQLTPLCSRGLVTDVAVDGSEFGVTIRSVGLGCVGKDDFSG